MKKHPFFKKNINDAVSDKHLFDAHFSFLTHGCIASCVVSDPPPPPPPRGMLPLMAIDMDHQ